MCSINYIQNGNKERAERTLELLKHRGPDSQRYYQVGEDTIGATRLAIVDVEKGQQPIKTADERYTVAFNGEVYNHNELREMLEGQGRKFNTHCDTEVVLNAVAKKGNEAAEDFDGQFAYVVKDAQTGTVYAGRDQFGIRPLYFGDGENGFVIASEIQALLANGVSGEAVRSLPQGCTLERLVDGTTTINRYYDVRDHVREEKADPSKLYDLLNEAVAKRIPEEVPHATILSGIDSSTVAYLAHQQNKKPAMTYTVATDPDSDDLKCAKLMAEQLGVKNRVGYIDESFVKEHLKDVVRSMATPFYFPLINSFPTLKLAQMAKEDGIKVILTGSGSDEANMGYDYLWELFDEKYMGENALNLIRSIGDNECVREDRILASQGLEGRVPFLDRKVVEYALSTPLEDRLPEKNASMSKKQLREAMRGKLPDYIVNRKKEALYRSTGVIPLMDKVAEGYWSEQDVSAEEYIDSLKGTGWEYQIMGGKDGKTGAMFHKVWSEEFPELAKVPLKHVSCGYQNTPPFENLEDLSRYYAVAGGGIHLDGWTGGVK